MAHAKKEHLDGLQLLLSEIRKSSALKEKSHGCFYFKSKGVLHFHIKDTRLFAHVFDGKIWHEVDLVTPMKDKCQIKEAKKIVQLLSI